MNSLSWLIYLANVTGSLSGFFTFITVVCGVGGLLFAVIAIINLLDTTDSYSRPLDSQQLEQRVTRGKGCKKAAYFFAVGLVISGMLSALSPDRKTVLLIAASEIGEKVITNQKVQGVIDPSVELLKTWIEQQTQSIRKEMEQQTSTSSKKTN